MGSSIALLSTTEQSQKQRSLIHESQHIQLTEDELSYLKSQIHYPKYPLKYDANHGYDIEMRMTKANPEEG